MSQQQAAARKEFYWVLGHIVAVVVCIILGAREGLPGHGPAEASLLEALAFGLTVAGGAVFVTLDCRRLGREVGPWRFCSILLGPFAVCVYLACEYGERSFFMIPIVVLIYGVVWLLLPFGLLRLAEVWF